MKKRVTFNLPVTDDDVNRFRKEVFWENIEWYVFGFIAIYWLVFFLNDSMGNSNIRVVVDWWLFLWALGSMFINNKNHKEVVFTSQFLKKVKGEEL